MQTSSFQLNTPTTHEFGIQCEIKTHCVDAGTQTETFADPVPLKVEFQSQAPEVYSVPANVHAVLKDHPYSKRKRITSSTPKKPKGGRKQLQNGLFILVRRHISFAIIL